MAWCPFAKRMNIAPGSSDPRIDVVGAILHVDAGNNASLFRYFNGPSNGIESHFHIRKDGVIEQYRNTGYEADANYKANSFYEGGRRKGYVSIETQGFEHGEWTPAQMESIKRLLVWLSNRHDFPLRECRDPRDPGVGYHTLFGAPSAWTPVSKSCPGPDRKRQFHGTLVPWFKNPEEDDISAKDVWNEDLPELDGRTDRKTLKAKHLLAQTHNRVGRVEKAVKALAKGFPAEVQEAVEAALAESVEFDVTIAPKDGE